MLKKYLIAVFLMWHMNAFAQTKITSSTFGMMEARHIGPAVMGGRITSIDAVNSNPRIMYVSAAGGGVWKTLTGGSFFKPIFEKYSQSIGAIAIDQNHPDTLWVGTGESNMRNTVSIGTGLYKSTDAGENWTKVGLDSTEHISRIIIDPRNSNVVYVAVPGALWGDSKHRGLYKTTDGGTTWNKILYTDVKTGCAEILMNPKNPDELFASMWQFRRTPYSFSSGGKTGALYKSTDAGKTWRRIQKGLPEGEFGRIAINIAPSEPKKLFAIVESKNTGLYLSDDGGETWREQSSTFNVNARPFYFSVIQVDPKDAQRIYRPAFSFSISDDGGQSFSEASQQGGWVHGDMHALWINPNNTSHMYLGTDGGVYMSLDRGNNWIFLNNISVSQFYHVQTDSEIPYNVYGGLQDNGSWTGPSQSINGIENRDWENVGGGDGFWVQPDRTDKNIVYSESQGGEAARFNRKTNESASIKPQPLTGETKLRFNWNTPLYMSPTNPNSLYIAAQYLYRTHNKGITWERISPDLTTNDSKKQTQEESGGLTVDNSSAENHCTIFTICESPLDENLIWVGTDDGNLQVTIDGGKIWRKVNTNIPVKDLPAQTWVSSIEASRFDKKIVYVTFDNHSYGDMKSYVFKSSDLGKSWQALSTSELKGYAHKIKEDIVSRKLLFLGTELGLYISFDGGESWVNDNAKVPPVAVRDIVIEPRTNDLVLATHGRGILIVDDISPLRNLTPEIINAEAAFLPTRPTPLSNGHFGGAFPGAGGFVGSNATEEAVIIYYLKERVST
ncbi:MAG: glycosyl hydrolase, partial [Bacteroidia bacterium]|nr:glycosyl hydrolase [Bacteroidia bacterium]